MHPGGKGDNPGFAGGFPRVSQTGVSDLSYLHRMGHLIMCHVRYDNGTQQYVLLRCAAGMVKYVSFINRIF